MPQYIWYQERQATLLWPRQCNHQNHECQSDVLQQLGWDMLLRWWMRRSPAEIGKISFHVRWWMKNTHRKLVSNSCAASGPNWQCSRCFVRTCWLHNGYRSFHAYLTNKNINACHPPPPPSLRILHHTSVRVNRNIKLLCAPVIICHHHFMHARSQSVKRRRGLISITINLEIRNE